MIKNILLTTALFASIGAAAQTLSYHERVQQYILQYKDLAKSEQQRSGVPAAITLGQGILETEAGKSELATLANNHFGIKCKKEWTGETFAHDDDAPKECFRKYPTALQSYKDHSDYLKTSKRYQPCFAQSPTDYAAWARELRKCGYATNPRYAHLLIKIIEEFHLQDYTYAALNTAEQPALIASAASPVAAAMMTEKGTPGEVVPQHDTPVAGDDKRVYGQVIRKNGVKGFYARKGDVLLEYAIQFKVRYAKLLEINGLPDAPLVEDMFVSLERGGRITQMISRDVSAPAQEVTSVAPVKEIARNDGPVVTASAPPAQADAVPASATPVVAVSAPPVQTDAVPASAAPVVAVSAPPVRTDAVPAPVAVVENQKKEQLAAVPAATAQQPGITATKKHKAPVEKPINIANEVAVEEMKPAAKDEPQDEFARLKARFDKVVYAPAAPRRVQAPVTTTTVVAAPEKSTAPVLASAVDPKVYHTVKRGETAFGIAKQYGISMKELMSMNGLDFEAIQIGQKLRVK